jgi:hypothetical protein
MRDKTIKKPETFVSGFVEYYVERKTILYSDN